MSGPTLSPQEQTTMTQGELRAALGSAIDVELSGPSYAGMGDAQQASLLNAIWPLIEQQLTEAEARLQSGFDVARVMAWAESAPRQPAHIAFTAGPERQAAYLIERAVAEAEARLASQGEQIAQLGQAIRAHRDARGDDRCWRDDEELYATLPEGFTPPARDTAVELELCRRYIASRQHPATVYVSPQREIERLTADLAAALTARDEAEQRTTWQPMETAIKSGRIMLVKFRNALGNSRVIRAYYAPPRTVEIKDVDAFGADYDADEDKAWLPEGWYEAVEFDEDRPSYQIEDVLLGWMPLPSPLSDPSADPPTGKFGPAGDMQGKDHPWRK